MPQANIDVGRNGDCGFESIAARLIDLQRKKKLQGTPLDSLFKVYRFYFPNESASFSDEEVFDHLIKTSHPRLLVKHMAFALRQYAVNEMVAHPEDYPGAFADNTEGTSPAKMRRPGTWIDGSALAAVAKGLKIGVVIHCGEVAIPFYESNQPRECKEDVDIILSRGHYQPYVSDPDYFSQVTPTVTANLPIVQSHDPTLEEINKKIQQFERIDRKREANAHHILEQLSTEDLVTLYQQMLPYSDYLPNRILMVTDKYDGDLFFYSAIIHNEMDITNEEVLKGELLHALSKQAYIDKNFYEREVLPMERSYRGMRY